jgi:calmodulin
MALTDQQELEFRDTFSLFDRNGNDSIPSADLGTLLRTLGHFPSSEELRKMKDKYETSADRTISWDGGAAGGFRELITARIKSSASPASIIDAFKVFDPDGTGMVSTDTFRTIIKLGKRLNEQEAEEMVKAADIDGSHMIDYCHFVKSMLAP